MMDRIGLVKAWTAGQSLNEGGYNPLLGGAVPLIFVGNMSP